MRSQRYACLHVGNLQGYDRDALGGTVSEEVCVR